MFTAIIAFVLFIVGLVTGYALRPRIDRKISYKKRGQATRKRAAAKRAAQPQAEAKAGSDKYLNSNGTRLN